MTMNRKWTLLTVVSLTTAIVASSAAFADDESPLHLLMEKVNKSNTAIRKATRTPVEYKKAGKREEVEKDAKEFIKLGKEARAMKTAITSKTPPYEKWTKLMDEFIKSSEELAAVAAKADSTQVQAKDAFTAVGKTCTNCHTDFRVEE